jgi:hypothetical protein
MTFFQRDSGKGKGKKGGEMGKMGKRGRGKEELRMCNKYLSFLRFFDDTHVFSMSFDDIHVFSLYI